MAACAEQDGEAGFDRAGQAMQLYGTPGQKYCAWNGAQGLEPGPRGAECAAVGFVNEATPIFSYSAPFFGPLATFHRGQNPRFREAARMP